MLKDGQVLWLKFRFNNTPGDISTTAHPYVIVDIDTELSSVEIIQCDSAEGKMHKAYMKQNHFISADGETVFSKHGFAQLDNSFKVELFDGLDRYKRVDDTLSAEKFNELKDRYITYQSRNTISENKTVYLSKKELQELNK